MSPSVLDAPIIWYRYHTYTVTFGPKMWKQLCANLAWIMTLNDVSHDLLPSIAWYYYVKNLGFSFVILVLQVMESPRESCRPVRRFYRSCVWLNVWFSWCFLFWPDNLGSHYSSVGATTLYEVWTAQRFSSMFLYP